MTGDLQKRFSQIQKTFAELCNNWQTFTVKKFLFFPNILTRREKWIYGVVLGIFLVSSIGLLGRIYISVTIPVPAIGGSYTEGLLKQPRAINPLYTSANDTDRDLARLIFSRIVTYTGDGSIELDLAKQLEISDDGKTYTVRLRDDVRWHDGEPLSADDVLFTIKRIQNPKYQSPLRANWQGVQARAEDASTIIFTLQAPYAPFIENLTVGILPEHLWQNVNPDQALLHGLNVKPVGSGPYRFRQFDQDAEGKIISYTVERNPDYYRDGPFIKQITFKFFETEDALYSAWRRGSVESVGPISKTYAPLIEQETMLEIETPRVFSLFFNDKKEPIFADDAVRRAIAHAINKEYIVEKVMLGGASIIDSPLPFASGFEDANRAELFTYPYDPDRARALLEEDDWIDKDGDGIREKLIKREGNKTATTTPLRFTLVTSDWPDLIAVAESIKTMLAEIGVDVTIHMFPFTELESTVIRPREFQLLLFGHAYGYEPDPFAFWHSSQIKDPGLNIANYTNKTVDGYLEDARRKTDPVDRALAYTEIEKRITKDLPAVFLFSQIDRYPLPADINGVELKKIALPADRFNEINKWYRNTKRVLK